ncbi:hypothetical protein CC2G_011718 [Coprinopsis cinerea AmutBmut pab1-1]|nr:hypothetical protein CC2G_011718 [Coprinopsis cinerea AmutBmut pab1-1]
MHSHREILETSLSRRDASASQTEQALSKYIAFVIDMSRLDPDRPTGRPPLISWV